MFNVLAGHNVLKLLKKHLCPLPILSSYAECDMQIGEWTFKRFPFHPAAGYFSDGSNHGRGVALLKDNTPWMSITPSECESHLIAQYSATGTTVIAGLGLGMITLSLLNKKEVKKIIVLEYDPDLIEGFESMLTGKTLNLWRESVSSGRVTICECDCKKPLPENILKLVKGCDYLWVDIWEVLFYREALSVTKYLQDQIQSKKVDYWGCELDLIVNSGKPFSQLNVDIFQDSGRKTGMPMSVLSLTGKPLKIYMALSAKALEVMFKTIKKKEQQRE